MNAADQGLSRPNLSLRRPGWLVVLAAMLGFGLLQEQAKIKVNHYLKVGDAVDFWSSDTPDRETWWIEHAPVGRHNFYVSRSTWPVFHGLDRGEVVAFKWGLSAAVLLVFFVLDVLLLRAAGVAERTPWLVGMYITASLPMLGFVVASPGESIYALARDMLGFLQSPLPSLLVVLVPWFLDRMAKPSSGPTS